MVAFVQSVSGWQVVGSLPCIQPIKDCPSDPKISTSSSPGSQWVRAMMVCIMQTASSWLAIPSWAVRLA